MNLVTSHSFAFLPSAYAAAGQKPATQTDPQPARAAPATDDSGPTQTKASSESQRELRLQAQLRVKQAQEQRLIEDQVQTLSARDREVRAHEQAHVAAGGQYAGAPVYQYERGPNGVSYAVGGEVPISTGAEATPEATLRKAQIIRRAALAPSEPSPQDRSVAAMASRLETSARAEITLARTRKDEEPTPGEAEDKTAESTTSTAAAKEADSQTSGKPFVSARQQDELARLERKLFTRDKMASSPPGTLLSHMA
jgi:hypothetical protein